MGTNDHRYISCDTHIYEPAGLWASRMRGKFADKAPYIDSRPEGDFYMIDGVSPRPCGSCGANLTTKIAQGEIGERPARHDDARKEASDPKLRLNDQDLDNVRAEIIYPNLWELGITNAPDPEYAQACAQVYNDWLAEFCAVAPDRLIGAALLTTKGPIEWSIAEANRVAKMGFRSVHIPVDNVEHPYGIPDGYYEKFWATLQDLGLIVACHASSSTIDGSCVAGFQPGTPVMYQTSLIRMQPQTLGNFIGGAICQRFPDLKIVMVECGTGWIPSILDSLDVVWEQYSKVMEPHLDEPPSYYFKRQMYATFEHSKEDVAASNFLPADRFLWGNDYPHVEGTFPSSKEAVEACFAGVPEEVVRKMTAENAAKLYRI